MWPGLTALAMLAALLALGTWQLQRRAWKLEVLAQIVRGEASPAIPLPADPQPYTKVFVEGRLREDLTALYGIEVRDTPSGRIMGARLLTPLERPGADPVIVDRGWLPIGPPRSIPASPDPVRVEGYVRPPEKPLALGVKDDPLARRFYALDPAAVGEALGLRRVAPFAVVALGTVPPGTYPQPARGLPRPPNNHLMYAFTWFGIAGALVLVFAVYCRKVLRS